ncbi:MAG: SRPBCC domain-containing protein [Planctomycetes bacterium]|nr:SRPBCC domain-containing protein [Planctomycetota bacterium]
MHPLLVAALVVLGLAALIQTAGMFVPRNHSVSVRARYARPPGEVWAAITDIDALPSWRSDVRAVERRPDVDGRPAWVERTRHGKLPLEAVEWDPPRRLVTRIADDARRLPFGGTWTWTLREVPGGTELTIAENGFIRSALFRVLAHFVLGYRRTIETLQRDLARRLAGPRA